MSNNVHPIEVALLNGSRSKSFTKKIHTLCVKLPSEIGKLTDKQRCDIIRLAGACRSTKAVKAALTITELPSIDSVPDFHDLFNEVYYPVLEDGKRTVGFWSVKDSVILAPTDIHEWVRDNKLNKKTGKYEIVPVPFGTWWNTHKPDYEIFGVASDRAQWNQKVIYTEERMCINMMYDRPPVLIERPSKYGNGEDANMILDALLERTITDKDENIANLKRKGFVLDAGSHLLSLRDFKPFRCNKIFCFTSTNEGQGTGKSFLHESIAALVPRSASCTVPTTTLSGTNMLPLYNSSVCVLTEAPSNANERYTAEDIKAFADAGWKTAEEKYVAKRGVKDNSLKLLSSNHLAPLPVDSIRSRRMEFFISKECDDGGLELRLIIEDAQKRMKWTQEDVRSCVGWALIERARVMRESSYTPCMVARRTIDSAHILSVSDYDYFVTNCGNTNDDYSEYKDFRKDQGFTWNPNRYQYLTNLRMSKSSDTWVDGSIPEPTPVKTPPPPPPSSSPPSKSAVTSVPSLHVVTPVVNKEVIENNNKTFNGFQYKERTKKALLEPNTVSIAKVYNLIVKEPSLISATEKLRSCTDKTDADKLKKTTLPQIFPSTYFKRYSRRANIEGYTGFTHIDFDDVSNLGNGLTPCDVRNALSELPGFVIGALSSRGNGAWAIFYAGEKIVDEQTFVTAQNTLRLMCEEKVSMPADSSVSRPTVGRVLAHDPNCCISDLVIMGQLPKPYSWKPSTYSVVNVNMGSGFGQTREMTPNERVRQERFLEVVVSSACEKVQSAASGGRHDTAIKAAANIILCCKERGMTPLSSWARQLRDACVSCGLPKSEVDDIMQYWKQNIGVTG